MSTKRLLYEDYLKRKVYTIQNNSKLLIKDSNLITNKLHTTPYNQNNRRIKYFSFYLSIIIAICAVLSVVYGGYIILNKANKKHDEGMQYRISGTCICTDITSSDDQWYHIYWTIYNFSICYNNYFGKTFVTESGNKVKIGHIKQCYSNTNCTEIFLTKTNDYIIEAIWLYVGCSTIFLCAFILFMYLLLYTVRIAIHFKIDHISYWAHDDERFNHNLLQWDKIKSQYKFDYFINYYSRKLEIYLPDNICGLLYKFIDEEAEKSIKKKPKAYRSDVCLKLVCLCMCPCAQTKWRKYCCLFCCRKK